MSEFPKMLYRISIHERQLPLISPPSVEIGRFIWLGRMVDTRLVQSATEQAAASDEGWLESHTLWRQPDTHSRRSRVTPNKMGKKTEGKAEEKDDGTASA